MFKVEKKHNIGDTVAEKCGKMAKEYDHRKKEHLWLGPDVVFGMVYEFIKPGESMLDIGIGTGLGSVLFHNAGLRVYGMDMSPEMLEICRAKNFTEDLKVHDLTSVPYPYSDASLDHAVCIGVLNHFENLQPVFGEASRILKNNGIFAFIVADRKSNEQPSFQVEHGDSRSTMYRHNAEQIGKLLQDGGFTFIKGLEFSVSGHKEKGRPLSLKAYVAERQKRI